LDLCNNCDELWSDDHNYIKFLIKLASLVKLGVIYFILLSLSHPCSYPFSMIYFMSLISLTRSLAESAAPGATNKDGAVPHRPNSVADQHGEHYRQHASPDEPSSTTTSSTS
jgi:hypothetical protein